MPSNRFTATRIAMSRPIVMIATTKTGLPTIGRRASRSRPIPKSPVTTMASATAMRKPSHIVPPARLAK